MTLVGNELREAIGIRKFNCNGRILLRQMTNFVICFVVFRKDLIFHMNHLI